MSTLAATSVQLLWQDHRISSGFKSGVSLHSHTSYSEENLGAFAQHVAALRYLRRVFRRRSGEALDFGRAFWTPPVSPRQAYRTEEKQIQRSFELPALVSLTDHDDIRAGALLRVLDRFRNAPVSTEWTVPFENTFFHLGVHNIPASKAAAVMEEMRAHTATPHRNLLSGILEKLDSIRDVLVVINHPLWDEHGLGCASHEHVLRRFLRIHGARLHALEVNGLRRRSENERVFAWGRQLGLPVVAGGDRHGREPNAVLNLSHAATLPEFIEEVRVRRFSHVVFMPQYRKPMALRVLHSIFEVLRDYPNNMFYREPDSASPVPLASVWDGNAAQAMKQITALMQLVPEGSVHTLLFSRVHERGCPRWEENQSGDS